MESNNKAEKFWDRTAHNYDKEEKKDEPIYLKIIEKTRTYLEATDIVLDFGCGTGQAANEVAKNVKQVEAIDTSSKMIEIANNKATAHKIQNIKYAQISVFDSKHVSGSFDKILAFYILHLLDNTSKSLQRLNELLKPGGIVISATPCLSGKSILNSVFSIISKIGVLPNIKRFEISELERLFKEANFEIIEIECLHKRTNQYLIIAKKK